MSSLPSLPPNLNGIKHYLEMADDYDMLALPISYWCRLFALKQGFHLQRAKEDVYFLKNLIEVLQTSPQRPLCQKDISNDTDARHFIQSVATHLHDWANCESNLEHHNKDVVKAYYSVYMLFNICSVFEELNEDISLKAQHAKFMAAHVQNLLIPFIGSSLFSRAKEVLNSYLKDTLEYYKTESTNDCEPDVVVELVARFVKSLASSPRKEKESLDKVASGEMLKNVRGILDLLSPSNFEELSAKIQALDIHSEDQLAGVTNLFFEKAINEPTHSSEYEKQFQQSHGYRQTPPNLGFPMNPTYNPAVDYPTQQQRPQQIPVAPPPTAKSPGTCVASCRARSSNLRIVDPRTNRDILTGEQVPVSASVTSITATPSDNKVTTSLLLQKEETLLEIKDTDTPLMPDSSVTNELTRKQKVNQRTNRRKKDKKKREAMERENILSEESLLLVQKAGIEPDSPKMDIQIKKTPKSSPVATQSVVEKTKQKPIIAIETESVITNRGKQGSSLSPSVIEMTPSSIIATDDGKIRAPDHVYKRPCAAGNGAGQVPSRLPLVFGLQGPNSTTPATSPIAASYPSFGGMPQGPPTRPMQGRPPQENNTFFVRAIRPGIQHMPRPHMAGGTIDPIHPPNAPRAYPGLNQPVLFVIGDQSNQKEYLSYPSIPPAYCPPSGNLPSENVLKPRATQQVMTPSPTTETDDGENRAHCKSTSLKYTYENDQWSPVNPEGKKAYGRNFLLELRNNPASQIKPEGLSCLEIVGRKVLPKTNSRKKVAVVEPTNSSIYAKMCQALLTKEVKSASNPAESTNFRKLLLIRCQKEFEKNSLIEVESKKKEIADTEAKKKELELELQVLVNSNRKKSLGSMRFIGELLKLKILPLSSMHHSILQLLSQPEDEVSLECLCVLLTTIGKELETPTNDEPMNSYFYTLEAILHQRKISNRIRVMIQDVIELRKTGWKLCHEGNNPKIDQTHKEVHKERAEKERKLNMPEFQGSMGGLSRGGRMYDRRESEDLNRKQSSPYKDDLNMKQNQTPKASGNADKRMTSCDQRASDVKSQSMIDVSAASKSTRSKRYQFLEDDSGTLAQHKELETLSRNDSLFNDGGGVGKSKRTAAVVVTPASRVNISLRHSLEKYLRNAGKLSTNDVCSWIQKQFVGKVNHAFIRAVVIAVIESSIEGDGTNSKLNNSVLKRWTEVLRRYVDNIAERELQLLYAVQTLVTQRQHPQGLIQGIFKILYDNNVVSVEGFESWMRVDDPLEREGKAVCLKVVASFFTQLIMESDSESDPDVLIF